MPRRCARAQLGWGGGRSRDDGGASSRGASPRGEENDDDGRHALRSPPPPPPQEPPRRRGEEEEEDIHALTSLRLGYALPWPLQVQAPPPPRARHFSGPPRPAASGFDRWVATSNPSKP
jgi:hypothetical protein